MDTFGPHVVATVMLDNRQDEYRLGIWQNFDVLIDIVRVRELRNPLTDNPVKPRKGLESLKFTAVDGRSACREESLEPSELHR